jgi:hypothetical protein
MVVKSDDSQSKLSRRTALIVVVAILIAILLCVVTLRDDRAAAPPSDTITSHYTLLLEPEVSDVPPATPKAPDQMVVSVIEAPTFNLSSEGSSLAPRDIPARFPLTGAKNVGVVDLARLLAAVQTQADSSEERARVLKEIQRAVAQRARAHELALVIDLSAPSAGSQTPFVLATNQPLDITEEVLKDLAE